MGASLLSTAATASASPALAEPSTHHEVAVPHKQHQGHKHQRHKGHKGHSEGSSEHGQTEKSVGPLGGLTSGATHVLTRPLSSGEQQYRNGCAQGYITDDCNDYSDSALRKRGVDPTR